MQTLTSEFTEKWVEGVKSPLKQVLRLLDTSL